MTHISPGKQNRKAISKLFRVLRVRQYILKMFWAAKKEREKSELSCQNPFKVIKICLQRQWYYTICEILRYLAHMSIAFSAFKRITMEQACETLKVNLMLTKLVLLGESYVRLFLS